LSYATMPLLDSHIHLKKEGLKKTSDQ